MLIDIVFVILIVLAMIHGFRRGLIIAIFSFIAIIVGLAAAIKLSAVVAVHLGNSVKVSDRWLPILSFILVFILVVILIRIGAKFLQRTSQVIMLGWVDKLGGILLYAVIYITVFSIVLFYAEQINLVKPATIAKSSTYSFLQPWGPKAINVIGSVIPFFKNMFTQLQEFFGNVSQKIT